MSSLFNIEKLDSSNYPTWKIMMKGILIHHDYWDHVVYEPNFVMPLEPADLLKWKKTDDKALATIILSVKPSELINIKDAKSCKEAWEKLEQIHQPKGPARMVYLFKQLIRLKMKETASMECHLKEFSEVCDNLQEVDVIIPEELLIIILLCSLSDSYENFVIAMESRDVLPRISSLKMKLLEDEARRADRVFGGEASGESINKVLADSKKRNSFKKNVTCFTCKRKGHFSNQCTMRADKKKADNVGSITACVTGGNRSCTEEWCLDSGATSHMCFVKEKFSEFRMEQVKLYLANNESCNAEGLGTVKLITEHGTVLLKDVLYAPSLKTNYLSVSKFTNHRNNVLFSGGNGIVKNSQGDIFLKASKENDMYYVREKVNKMSFLKEETFMQWHERFGHLNGASLMKVADMVYGLNLQRVPETIKCITCAKGKIATKPFPKESSSRSQYLLELIHSDVCGPLRVSSAGGARYLLTFIDDKSRKNFIYLLKSKSEVFEKFKEFKSMVECETSRKIKKLRTDNGGEYMSKDFERFLKEAGIQHQTPPSYTPQQNGVAERANRTIMEMVRCLLLQSNLDHTFWGEAAKTAVYIRNRCPSKILGTKTPFEIWTGRRPSVKHFKVFGSKAVYLNKKPGKNKLGPKGRDCIMMGYSEQSKAYRVYDVESKLIITTRDVQFFEEAFDNVSTPNPVSSNSEVVVFEIPYESGNPNNDSIEREEEEVPMDGISMHSSENATDDVLDEQEDVVRSPRRGRGRPKLLRTGSRGRPKKRYQMVKNVSSEDIIVPRTVSEAQNSNEWEKWDEAIQKELGSLNKNRTWDIVDLPTNAHVIGCRWVFAIKRKPDGTIERFKARLVAKGCSQKYNIDYFETFSPVVRQSSIRLILSLAAQYELLVHHLDVTTAFLNGDLHDEIYMSLPENITSKYGENKVCKLRRSLYGLKQAGREWNVKLHDILLKIGFQKSNGDACVYTNNFEDEKNLIGVYVDDLIIASSSLESMNRIKGQINKEFELVDNGEISMYLGVNIERSSNRGSFKLSQRKYIENILEKYNMVDCKNVFTPLNPGVKLSKCNECTSFCKKVDIKEYQSLIGSLLYLSICTRPDITFSVNKLSQFNHNPHEEHLNAAKHLLRYLSYTKKAYLLYDKGSETIQGFADADWGSDELDRKSYSGSVFVFAGAAINWESKKQSSVALSSTEAEYISLSQAGKEAVYLTNFVRELGFDDAIGGSITLRNDNLSAQQLIKNPVYHARSKHIDIRFHYVREIYEKQIIDLQYQQTDEMMADVLTKNLPRVKHEKFRTLLGIKLG